ncbi:MAG: hypothetical protein INH41_03785 [Myxococcaceae bacterium]|nr:hypothetical protein [Myxococcaceae bacterium]MCA3011501.1 hypothetical protein [Myxococcaceae bacterium]
MEGFLRTLLTFPAVPYTVLLGISFLYWVFVLLGVVAFDGDGALEGGVKAAGDALTGGVKAAGEAVSGGAKGAVESLKAAGSRGSTGDGLFSVLGFGKVPATISGSLLVFFGWVFSMFGSSWLGADAGLAAKAGVLFASLLLSLVATAAAVRPLGKAFHSAPPARRHHFIGKVCEVTSGRVDGAFGTAIVGDGGAGLNLHVVCEKANGLKKGDKALIVGFDDKTETWDVEPLDWLEPQELEALNDPERIGQVISMRMRTRG